MKAVALISGTTLVVVAGLSIGSHQDGHQGCGTTVQAAVPYFDPFQLQGGAFVQEPWLDPLVFFSDKAYVVEALPALTTTRTTDAVFAGGRDSLVGYLKRNLLPHIRPGIGWLKPPVVQFTVNARGEATHVSLAERTGHAALDAQLLRVISDMPRWTPAKDAQGSALEQACVFKVVQGGCAPPPAGTPNHGTPTGQHAATDTTLAYTHPYDLVFTLERATDNTYTLVTTIKLFGGSFYASPNCTRDLKGKFHVEVEEQGRIRLADKIKEIPLVLGPGFRHPLVHGPAEWVSVDTRYEQGVLVTGQQDMEVNGKYRFTIEPRCTMEEIPFVIKQRGGRLTIERVGC